MRKEQLYTCALSRDKSIGFVWEQPLLAAQISSLPASRPQNNTLSIKIYPTRQQQQQQQSVSQTESGSKKRDECRLHKKIKERECGKNCAAAAAM
jgi:hypothetical protein